MEIRIFLIAILALALLCGCVYEQPADGADENAGNGAEVDENEAGDGQHEEPVQIDQPDANGQGDENESAEPVEKWFVDMNNLYYAVLEGGATAASGEEKVLLSLYTADDEIVFSQYFGLGDAIFWENGKVIASIHIEEIITSVRGGTKHYSIIAYRNVR